jgi:hypothetical protein
VPGRTSTGAAISTRCTRIRGATWSGVYYVDHGEANDAVEGTALQLFDPNPARTNIFFPS